MKSASAKTRSGAALQDFWAPPHQPWLEIRNTADSRQSYAEHFHLTFSVGLIAAGETRVVCAGTDYQAQTGDIVLIEPGAVHKCNPLGDGARSYHMIYLDPAWCLAQAGWPDSAAIAVKDSQRVVRDIRLFQALAASAEEIFRHRQANEAELGGLIGQLLRGYCRAETSGGEARPPVAEARRRVGADLENRVRMAEVARGLGLSREGFIRSFRRSTGMTPGGYRHCLRLLAARRLLRQGVHIAQAALAAGYVDQSHFHRMFVKYFSVTPGQYRVNRSLFYNK